MKYTIRPSGHFSLVEKGLAKVYQDNDDGGRNEIGDYKNALLPYGAKSHRVFFDSDKRRYDIDLSKTELNKIAKAMHLMDPETKLVIVSANPLNEFDPFFKHRDLVLEVPNNGLTMDSDEPLGAYWLAAMKAEPKKFDIDGETDNPLVKKIQDFRVTTAQYNEQELSTEFSEGERATGIYHAIKDDMNRMIVTCRAMDIVVGENPDIEMLRQAIYLKITIDKDFKTKDGVRFIERFLQIGDMNEDDRGSRAMIGEAKGLGVIEMKGRVYTFEGTDLGTSADRAFQFLQREENGELKAILISRLKEKKGQIEVKAK